MAGAYYQRIDAERFQPSIHVQGAWRDDEQHMAPVSGLIAHALERHDPHPGLVLARVSFDILGIIRLAPIEVRVRTARHGRSIELLEAVAARSTRGRSRHARSSPYARTAPDLQS